jgi:hypothetical protein
MPVTHAEDSSSPIPLVTPLAAGDMSTKVDIGYEDVGEVNPSALASSIIELSDCRTRYRSQHLCAPLQPLASRAHKSSI